MDKQPIKPYGTGDERARWLVLAIEPFVNILTNWEASFIQTIEDALSKNKPISDARLAKLEEIKEKYT